MAKKTKRNIPVTPPAIVGMPAFGMPQAFGFGFGQPAHILEPRKIVSAKQRVSEYELDDGTVLTIRPVLIDAKRAKGQWGPNGKPVYILTMTNLNETELPKRLMAPMILEPKSAKKNPKRRGTR